ncbi:hypothetical protein AAC387_Pa05g0696 [Persea americana]
MNLLEHPVLSSQRYESPTSSCFEIERNERPNGVFSLFSLVNPEAKTERTKGFFQLGPNYAGTGPGQGRSVLVLNHVCIMGRAFRRSLMAANRGERSSDSSISMSANGLENFKMVDKCRLLPNCNHSFHSIALIHGC